MQRNAFRNPRTRSLVALTLFAWLAGSMSHGAMQIGGALGQEVCTAQGATYVPGEAPAQSGQPGGRSCTLCAAFGAPVSASAFVAFALPCAPVSALVHPVVRGAVLPASHLADLASRAPPRA